MRSDWQIDVKFFFRFDSIILGTDKKWLEQETKLAQTYDEYVRNEMFMQRYEKQKRSRNGQVILQPFFLIW